MPFEKIMNSIYEIWSQIIPERAIACAFNLEYLLTGGRDLRSPNKPIFMFYDWLPGGWGGRNGRDGCNVTTACFGTGLQSQPVEGQERGSPILTTEYQVLTDSPGPGKWRGGAGVRKTSVLREADQTVISYICDRERAVVWGINGGLPSIPHGLSLTRKGSEHVDWLGSAFSDVKLNAGDVFSRPTAGGGGFGDPLERDPALVCDDVANDYVSIERARKDYGVVLRVIDHDLAEYEVDSEATAAERARIRSLRRGWIAEDPEVVGQRFRAGELDAMDVIRRFAVVLDWDSGAVLPNSTAQFREMYNKRTASHWHD
jgi:N-methylhydantoinase B